LNYGKLVYAEPEPMEKLPLFHFYHGKKTFSIASPGGNFAYQHNEILKVFKDKEKLEVKGEDWTPEKVVSKAEEKKCVAISFTATEPAIYYEFVYRTSRVAIRENIKNIIVTNGFFGEDSIKKLVKILDAAVINIYASGDKQFYSNYIDVKNLNPIFKTIRQMKKHRVHVEIVNWVIPQIGDNPENFRKFVNWITSELHPDTPLHIMRFYPDHKFPELPPTPISTLENFIDIATRAGLRHVYIGNVPGHINENTFCYNCRNLLIEREGYKVKKIDLVRDRCPYCGLRINIKV
jgi:pyruvate formate lyase activating enzyme